ncbi:MAG: IS21 family transposase [Ferruginibacter sp.]
MRTGVNRWVLWGEYKVLHPDGYSYSQFCDHYSRWKATASGSFHQEYHPGEKLFIDYTCKKLYIVDAETGEVTQVEVYAAILGYIQLTYVEALPSQKKEDLIQGTENTFHFFGGVPKVIIPDCLKSAVTVADKYEAQINTAFQVFANHYGTCVLPARSRKPKDKAHVEKIVSVIYSRIFAPCVIRFFIHFLHSIMQ